MGNDPDEQAGKLKVRSMILVFDPNAVLLGGTWICPHKAFKLADHWHPAHVRR